MSTQIKKYLVCDGPCAEQYSDDWHRPIRIVRVKAKSDGWIRRREKDFCPHCANRLFAIGDQPSSD